MNHIMTFAPIVDQLADIKAQIAALELQEKELREMLIATGMTSIDGTLHTARISENAGRVTIDWQTIAERFNPSRQLITAHTTIGNPFHVVRMIARKGAK